MQPHVTDLCCYASRLKTKQNFSAYLYSSSLLAMSEISVPCREFDAEPGLGDAELEPFILLRDFA